MAPLRPGTCYCIYPRHMEILMYVYLHMYVAVALLVLLLTPKLVKGMRLLLTLITQLIARSRPQNRNPTRRLLSRVNSQRNPSELNNWDHITVRDGGHTFTVRPVNEQTSHFREPSPDAVPVSAAALAKPNPPFRHKQ